MSRRDRTARRERLNARNKARRPRHVVSVTESPRTTREEGDATYTDWTRTVVWSDGEKEHAAYSRVVFGSTTKFGEGVAPFHVALPPGVPPLPPGAVFLSGTFVGPTVKQ